MKKLLTLLPVIFIVLQCSSEKSDDVQSLIFDIDSSKIASLEKVHELGIQFHPPINWSEVDTEVSDQIINKLGKQNKDDNFFYKPVKIYVNSSTNSLLAVGSVNPPNSKAALQDNIDAYIVLIDQNFKESITKKGTFSKDKLLIHQFLIQKQNLISFKLIFESDNKILQFDYTSQKINYENDLKSIESSMGTINKLIN